VPVAQDGASHLFLIHPRSKILKVLYLGVLAVRDLREENSILPLGIEVLSIVGVLVIVLTRPWVGCAGQVVLSGLVWFKDLPLNFARLEIWFHGPHLSSIFLGVIGSRSNSIKAHPTICILGNLLRRDRWCPRLGLDDEVAMLVGVVSLSRALELSNVIPLEAFVIGPRTRVID
jgi:hypothetical protein